MWIFWCWLDFGCGFVALEFVAFERVKSVDFALSSVKSRVVKSVVAQLGVESCFFMWILSFSFRRIPPFLQGLSFRQTSPFLIRFKTCDLLAFRAFVRYSSRRILSLLSILSLILSLF